LGVALEQAALHQAQAIQLQLSALLAVQTHH